MYYWTSQGGRQYDIEAAPDLTGWTKLNGDPIDGTQGEDTTTFVDVASFGLSERYYRVTELAP